MLLLEHVKNLIKFHMNQHTLMVIEYDDSKLCLYISDRVQPWTVLSLNLLSFSIIFSMMWHSE